VVVRPRIEGGDDRDGDQDPQLRRNAEHFALAEHEEPVGIAAHRAGLADAFGKAAIEGERRQRRDQRRHLEARDDEAVDEAGDAADDDGEHHRGGQGNAEIVPEDAEQDGAEAEDRADREVDAAGDDDEGHRQGDQADLGHQAALIEDVGRREELVGLLRQEEQHDDQQEAENGLVSQEGTERQGHGVHLIPRRRAMSASTVARIRRPCTERSQ
jgi:hypothetical protein